MSRDVMIDLQQVSKFYRGQKAPVVENMSMTIHRGEIVVLVGPSGCGKTTTMKMINRLIEPSSGRILIDGTDVTALDGNDLRRQIGYVIQQVGLFPHMSVATNVGLVPKMLGWDRKRIEARVDELLHLVGLEPATYRNRLPRQLSGGQQQRVGVARALAADPPVMLMDEPFGATDPMTRDRLQNEFLRLQDQLRKTIVFVTHDFDEAIKMGTRIAVLGERSRIRQFDTPEVLLAHPADSTVAQFIGGGAQLKQLDLRRVDAIQWDDVPLIRVDKAATGTRRHPDGADGSAALTVDDDNRPLGWISAHDRAIRQGAPEGASQAVTTVEPQATLRDALDAMLASRHGTAVVVDEQGRYAGAVTLDGLMRVIHPTREQDRLDSAVPGQTTGEVRSALTPEKR
ncbi:ABC transporter ATP-binding protein [Salinispora arenicola]|uniref:ABC transporter ATP-binding protein n=1 Tax=Salinispora arenicola TaxID=168697 RepID=UPI00035E97E4|nr:betaine/proline/choline family ABC transporter ATP-binding protein [Salinispora arenicola]MCN0154031.1 betaine/proline/choline family ABC transporter ATP-binding protein [Salinispora arenicola]NIL40877.1 betaine/proline/choline family ABC transporter ATP-binding protein [Salinispora arenicola]NIL57523.1 betaine/proline/choline family ABC transporter ATP-binding protein [Salinispora arenicola]NIL61459.1 betaine/proline/choline family ABC transporter ATP-binding protein [Salinispora arenicola]